MTASKPKRETVRFQDVLRGIPLKLEETRNPVPNPEPAAQNPEPPLPRNLPLTLGIKGTARKSDTTTSWETVRFQDVLRGIPLKLEETRNPVPNPEPAAQNPGPPLPRNLPLGIKGTARKSDTTTSTSMFNSLGDKGTIQTSRG